MAGNITLALRTAQSGLLTSQSALDTVANNISNVNTPGYSRKVVNFEQRVVADAGAGVQLADITRNVDAGLIKSLRNGLTEFNELDVQVDYFERVQEMFGRPGDDDSINHYIQTFTESMEALALAPDRTIEQQEVVRWANEVSLTFESMVSTLSDLRLQADREIETLTDRVSVLLGEVEDLNNKIIRNETVSHDVTDLKDKRDGVLDELSTILDIQYFERSGGDTVVFTKGGHVLVDSSAKSFTHTAATAVTGNITYEEGQINGIFAGESVTSNDITSDLQGGQLKGLVDLRDNVLPNLERMLDELATELKDAVNLVHNRGAGYPGLQSVTGTRTFVDPGGTGAPNGTSDQTITLSGGDVTIVALDASGNQTASTTLDTIMQSATFGTVASAANGPWTLDEVAATIEDWLQDSANGGPGYTSASVTVDSDGHFSVNTNATSGYVAFRDETATADGSTASDVTIQYDANGDTTIDEEVSGFSNFLGLNDFFVTNLSPVRYDSEVKSSTYTWEPLVDTTLTFKTSAATETLTFTAAGAPYSLQEIADAINDTSTGISFATATVIQDGDGYRLRLVNDDSNPMAVVDDQGVGGTSSFIEGLNVEESGARAAEFLQVRSDIQSTPSLMSRGQLLWDSDLGTAGEYYMSVGDNSIAQGMAETLTSRNQFDKAGGLGALNVNFTDYAGSIVAKQASLADTNDTRWSSQKALTESLQLKSDNVKGVNLDEEMSNLILYQQAYSAAARVISVIKQMFDALENTV